MSKSVIIFSILNFSVLSFAGVKWVPKDSKNTTKIYSDAHAKPLKVDRSQISSSGARILNSPATFWDGDSSVDYGLVKRKNFQAGIDKDYDKETSNCTVASQYGYKCFEKSITTEENKTYKIRMLWNRVSQNSRGTAIIVSGGTSGGGLLNDNSTRGVHDRLDKLDQVRSIFLEFADAPSDPANAYSAGCWVHAGGYYSAGRALNSAVKLIVDDLKLVRGSFLNYMGSSNGSLLMSYAMSSLNLDQYFDRVVFQLGPVMANQAEACDRSNPNSMYALNRKEQQDFLANLFDPWLGGKGAESMCSAKNIKADRMSVLSGKRNFPGTHVHVIIGALEGKVGLGKFHNTSSRDWYNKISARTKSYLSVEGMQHNYSFKDMRRFLKLDPNQRPQEDTDCVDEIKDTCENGKLYTFNKRSCEQTLPPSLDPDVKWEKISEGNFKLDTGRACGELVPTASDSVGQDRHPTAIPMPKPVPRFNDELYENPTPTPKPEPLRKGGRYYQYQGDGG